MTEVAPASPELIAAMRSKGRTVIVVDDGSDGRRYLDHVGAEANVAGPELTHILLRPNTGHAAALEENLHGTQLRLGIIGRLDLASAERYVKEFMIRHRTLLGLSDHDVRHLLRLIDAGL